MSEREDPNPELCDTVSHSGDGARGSTAKDARAARSSAALRDALLALLERKSFEQITVRDICGEANVHYATFFRHHPSKEALLNHIAEEQIGTLVDLTLPIKDSVDYRTAFGALCTYVDEHRMLWSILLNGGAGPAMRDEWLRRARIVSEAREAEATWLPKELGTICSTSLIAETVSWWLAQPREAWSAEEIATILDRLVTSSTMIGG
jgi:AcrR family transcriptional regulator